MADYREILLRKIKNSSENISYCHQKLDDMADRVGNTGIINEKDFPDYVKCVLTVAKAYALINAFNEGGLNNRLAEKERELENTLAIAEESICKLFKNIQKIGGKPPEVRN